VISSLPLPILPGYLLPVYAPEVVHLYQRGINLSWISCRRDVEDFSASSSSSSICQHDLRVYFCQNNYDAGCDTLV